MTIFGDGLQTRAFTHIDDVAPVIARSIDVPAAANEAFNVGADTPYTVLDLAHAVARAFDVAEPQIEFLPARKEVVHAFSDHAKLHSVFGRESTVSLEEGLRRMAEGAREAGVREPVRFESVEVLRNLPPSWAAGLTQTAIVPDVSISLVNTNSRELLLACLESLKGVDAEIVVLDNASEDGSAAAVRERFPGRPRDRAAPPGRLRRQSQHRDPRDDRPLRLRPQRGHDERRLGLRADGRPPRREPARRRARPAARLSRRARCSPRPGASRPRRPRRSACSRSAAPGSSSRAAARRATSTGRWRRRSCVRREALDEVGLFDEEFFIYSEETDLSRRLAERRLADAVLPAGDRRAPRVAVQRGDSRAADQRDVARPAPLLAKAPLGRRRRVAAALLTGAQYAARALPARATATSRRGCACTRATRFASRTRPSRARRGLEPHAPGNAAPSAVTRAQIRLAFTTGGSADGGNETARRTARSHGRPPRRPPRTAPAISRTATGAVACRHRPEPGGGGAAESAPRRRPLVLLCPTTRARFARSAA